MGSVIVENGKKVLKMAECIYREALLEAFDHADADVLEDYGDGISRWGFGIENILKVINSIPAVDVAPVVRCRDCKHAWIHPCGYVYCHRDGRNAYEMTFKLDSFCSYGERKDNG